MFPRRRSLGLSQFRRLSNNLIIPTFSSDSRTHEGVSQRRVGVDQVHAAIQQRIPVADEVLKRARNKARRLAPLRAPPLLFPEVLALVPREVLSSLLRHGVVSNKEAFCQEFHIVKTLFERNTV
jgi:hypothetical protein